MNKSTVSIVLLTSLLPIANFAMAQTVVTSGTFPVPSWEWVKLEKPAKNGNNEFPTGDTCGIQEGGFVTILGIASNQQEALVRYDIRQQTYGTPCPNGAIFFLPIKKLEAYPRLLAEIILKREQRAQEVDRILDQSSGQR